MARPRATLKDVASHVGVHLSTVSRVLNPKTRWMVSGEVAEKILAEAEKLGYRTNPFAYSLRMNRSFTIGVLIPDLTNPIFPPIIRGVEHVLEKAGYTAILVDTDNRADEERVIIEKLEARQVDGLILATARRADDLIHDNHKIGCPVVLINRAVDTPDISSVTNDDAEGIALAVGHVAALGHRRIAHIAGPQQLSTGHDRYHAFLAAIRAHGLDVDEKLIAFAAHFSEVDGRKALNELLARGEKFSAVVAANDLLALGCYDALDDAGMVCPKAMSIVGFNDMPFVDKFKPPLTTIRIPLYEMGMKAAEALLEQMNNDDTPPRQLKLSPQLIIRGSTAPAQKI